ncbi:hypothetical protein RUM43_014689 [Polyplax serrata]|uniref:Prefoldin subunit 4 n=1 Tax=Polyplax serrata TaxID=468196 RepID=A0AAN8NI73_POLSC
MGDGGHQGGRAFQPDSDAYITFEDQQKINEFARCNAKNDDVKAELAAKQNELKNLEDAVEELVLFDEDEGTIPFLQGEVFMCLNLKETNRCLEKAKKKVSDDIRELEEIAEELKTVMGGLKTQLYAKFGNHINLEEED